ncbi:hypothetical protein SAMN05428989_2281 [Pseudoxanthomonas sp. GM95]|uniref:hypothetical protein n=1 Tax=Pseudoxanthomonas sp. GM95 TaxID=1881043 RepID=UPI0008BB0CAE|nr:hypothetical protein [Pseudoxanthomonas sp. GM95]SEL70002.1 hypothetical protein SAMN05428989_2281 [Pseudoxanthomonas sp. GM95]
MHHARQHTQTQTAERRRRLAHEAARLIAESGIRDYQLAKRKAASRLGIHDDASLPRNHEIEDALREYQRLFAGPDHAGLLRARREAAAQAMDFFSSFSPRLVGPVLDGTADARSPVQLHLHSDDEDAVGRFLEDHRIPADARVQKLRMDRTRHADVTVWGFAADGVNFDLAVLPRQALRQAPLSPVDEQPMARASASQLAALLASDPVTTHAGR